MQNIISFVGLFFAKGTYYFKEPTNRSHPITETMNRAASQVEMSHVTNMNTGCDTRE